MSSQQPILAQPSNTTFSDELKIVPTWAWVLGSVAFLCMQFVFNVVIPEHKGNANAPPAPILAFLGFLVGALCACYMLLIGYVNRDAGRRGMSRALWTVIVIFIPNALGFILYFLMR